VGSRQATKGAFTEAVKALEKLGYEGTSVYAPQPRIQAILENISPESPLAQITAAAVIQRTTCSQKPCMTHHGMGEAIEAACTSNPGLLPHFAVALAMRIKKRDIFPYTVAEITNRLDQVSFTNRDKPGFDKSFSERMMEILGQRTFIAGTKWASMSYEDVLNGDDDTPLREHPTTDANVMGDVVLDQTTKLMLQKHQVGRYFIRERDRLIGHLDAHYPFRNGDQTVFFHIHSFEPHLFDRQGLRILKWAADWKPVGDNKYVASLYPASNEELLLFSVAHREGITRDFEISYTEKGMGIELKDDEWQPWDQQAYRRRSGNNMFLRAKVPQKS